MKTELKEISPTRRELHIEIDPASLKDAYLKISQRYAKGASVPGFRKGYAPLDVIRLRYKEEIKQEVLHMLLPEKVTEAVREHGLNPLAEPDIHVEDIENVKVNGSEPVSLHVHVEVMPEIPTPDYKGIEIVRRRKPVDTAEIDRIIEHRRSEHKALIPVEGRASETGDTVIADLEGTFDDDKDGEPIMAKDLEVVLGAEDIEESFTENLIGVKPDDEKEFTVTYPTDFTSEALAGKTIHYKAKIKSVGQTELPELNDEWAQSLDEGFESLTDLKEKLNSDLEKYADADADARVRNEAVAKLIEANAFEVPNALIESQSRNLLNNFAQDLQRRGVDLNNVKSDFVTMAYEQMRSQAERDVRGAMLLERIAEAEKIEVGDKEVDEEIAKIAEQYRMTSDDVRNMLKEQGGDDSVRNSLRTRKSVEALVSNIKVVEGEWETPDAGEKAEETKAEKPKKAAKAKAPAAAKKAAKADKKA